MIREAEAQPVQAIGLMLLAVFLLSVMDVALKRLVEDYGSFQVVLMRALVSAPLFAAWMLARNRAAFRPRFPGNHLLRAAIGVVMLYAVGECFRELPLADAYVIFFAAPLLITLLSGPLLGERAGMPRIVAALVGFAGVVVLLRPGGGAAWLGYGAAMGLLAMLAYTATTLLLRRIGPRENTVTIAFWFTSLVGLGAAPFAAASWTPVNGEHWPWLLLLGVTGTLGQLCLVAAFRRASAAIIAPFDYTAMVWAVLFGFWVWGDLPDARTWTGAAIIVSSGLFILYREHRAARVRPAAVP